MLNLQGFVSTSREHDESLSFAIPKDTSWMKRNKRKSVMFYITLDGGTNRGYCFQMDKVQYTDFPNEAEILLDDGLPFTIYKIEKDQPVEHELNRFRGKLITRIYFKSMLPASIKTENLDKAFRLSSYCKYKKLVKNCYKLPLE